ncbi:MAG: patatin-like phospholipase family protein, partial [Bacteroidota bacterium]
METKKIGLVLSGGGHRGVAHAGAIKALEEYGISPNLISGSSAGALVGALYAADYKPEEMIKVFKNLKIFNISRYARKKPGFVDTNSFHGFLAAYFPENSFKFKKKELFITATDLVNAKIKVFTQGNLINSILASASFPGVFTPMSIDNCLYADGGILDNFR